MSKSTWIKISGDWKKIINIWIKENGVWKSKVIPRGKVNSDWKEFIEYTLKKSLEYQFNETTSNNRSNTFTLDDLISIDEITVDNGSVTYSIDGNKVTVNVIGGNSRSEYDSTKYSKSASDYKTSGTDSFPSNMNYSSDGYSGNLSKDGNSYVSSGSYTPSDSKSVSDYQTSSTDNFPSSMGYNSGGYSGNLSKDGNSYVSSGSYTPSSSKTITDYKTSSDDVFPDAISKDGYVIYKDGNCYVCSGSYTPSDSKTVTANKTDTLVYENGSPNRQLPRSINYNEDGYSGTLTMVRVVYPSEEEMLDYAEKSYSGIVHTGAIYSGTVTRPASDTRVYRQDYKKIINIPASDTRVYRQNYKGTVIKPSVDTRTYRQNYKGYVYKGGYNYYYKYKINMKYTIKN